MRAVSKRWIQNGLLLIVSASLPLIALEYYLRWDNARPDAQPYRTEIVLNGTKYAFFETKQALNDPANGVLIAGDSFTAGAACANYRTFPNAFSKAAAARGLGIHAVNLGVPGTGPAAYVGRVQDYLKEKGPAAGVIMSLYANDAEFDCFACQRLKDWSPLAGLSADGERQLRELCEPCLRQDSSRDATEAAGHVTLGRRVNWWLADNALSFLMFREGLAKIAVMTGLLPADWGRGSYPQRWRNVDGVYFKYLRGSMALAKQEAERHGMRMMVIIQPDSMNLTPSNEFYSVYQSVAAALREQTGLEVHSGYDAFVGNPMAKTNMPFSLSDTHPSCEANSIFGEWVLDRWTGTNSRDSDDAGIADPAAATARADDHGKHD
jgi:hypothetical protein